MTDSGSNQGPKGPSSQSHVAEFEVVPPGPIHKSKKMMLAKFLQVWFRARYI